MKENIVTVLQCSKTGKDLNVSPIFSSISTRRSFYFIREMFNSKKLLPFLKLSTAISYCCVIAAGDHVGGPIGIFLLFGLFSMHFLSTVISIFFMLILCLFIWSVFNPQRKRDMILFFAGGVVLLLPILIEHLTYLAFHVEMWTLYIFLTTWILTLTMAFNTESEIG